MNAKIIVGILASFLLGGVMYFVGKDTIESLIIGMLGSIFTILFSTKIDMDESQKTILNSIKTSKKINSTPILKDLISSAIKNYKKIEKYNNKTLQYEAIESLRRFSVEIEDLSTKKINTEKEDVRVKILFSLLKEAKNNIYSVSYLDRWEEELGRKTFIENEKSIKNGIEIERIFLLERESKESLEIITKHFKIGVKCFVAIESKVPDDLRKYMILIDKIAITIPIFNKNGVNNGGFISFDKKDISKSYDSWKRLKLYSEEIFDIQGIENKFNNKT